MRLGHVVFRVAELAVFYVLSLGTASPSYALLTGHR